MQYEAPQYSLSEQHALSRAHTCPRPETARVLSKPPDKTAGSAATDDSPFLLLLCFLLRLPSTVLGTKEQCLKTATMVLQKRLSFVQKLGALRSVVCLPQTGQKLRFCLLSSFINVSLHATLSDIRSRWQLSNLGF